MRTIKSCVESRYANGKIYEFDFSQLEVRVLAEITNCVRLRQELADGMDMHCKSMAMAHGMSYKDAYDWYKSGDAHAALARRVAKTISFQMSYGASKKAISEKNNIEFSLVDNYFKNYHSDYPEVKHAHNLWQKSIERSAVKTGRILGNSHEERVGTLELFSGREVSFLTYPTPKWLYDKGVTDQFSLQQIMNYPVQGTASDIVSLMYGILAEYLLPAIVRDDVAFVTEVHDSYVLDLSERACEEGTVEGIYGILTRTKEHFREAFGYNWTVDLPVDVECGHNWKDMKEVKVCK